MNDKDIDMLTTPQPKADASPPLKRIVIKNPADELSSFSEEQLKIIKDQVSDWSLRKSITKAVEELTELSVELLHLENRGSGNVMEEMADVSIALKHLEMKFGNIQEHINKKVGKGT